MPEPDYYLRQGDQGVLIGVVCRDDAGTPITVEGATARFLMAPISGGTKVAEGAAVDEVDELTVGEVSYEFQPADTDTPGWYLGEFEVTFDNGAVQTFPNATYILIAVTAQVSE